LPYQNFDSNAAFRPVQLPTYGAGAFTSPASMQPIMRGSFSGPTMNGFPYLGGQTDSAGIFRGYVAVPITTRFPVSRFGFNSPPTPYYPSGPTFGNQFLSQENFHENYGNYGNYGSDFQSQLHNNFELPLATNNRLPYFSNQGNRNLLSRFDDEQVPQTPEMNMDNYHSQNINLDEGGDFERPGLNDGGSSRGGDHFDPFFGGMFDRHQANDLPSRELPFETNFEGVGGNTFKRSSNLQHRSAKPFVFTKEHVGFGPITVEAHTASYRGEDPKEDD